MWCYLPFLFLFCFFDNSSLPASNHRDFSFTNGNFGANCGRFSVFYAEKFPVVSKTFRKKNANVAQMSCKHVEMSRKHTETRPNVLKMSRKYHGNVGEIFTLSYNR